MDEIVDQIVERTGLTRTQAEEAARITINFLKDRLPSTANSQIDSVLVESQTEKVAERVSGAVRRTFE